jgi:hypothetical protein
LIEEATIEQFGYLAQEDQQGLTTFIQIKRAVPTPPAWRRGEQQCGADH